VDVLAGTMRPLHAATLLGHADMCRTLLLHNANAQFQWAECTPKRIVQVCVKAMAKHVPRKTWFQEDFYTWHHTELVLDNHVCLVCGAYCPDREQHACTISHAMSLTNPPLFALACRGCGSKIWSMPTTCGRCMHAFCQSCADTFRVVNGASLVRLCNTCLHFSHACACRRGQEGGNFCEHLSSALGGVCECNQCLNRLVRARGPQAIVNWLVDECVGSLRAIERKTRELLMSD